MPIVHPALTLGAATTDVVTIAASAGLNNMTSFTALMWVYLTTLTNSRTLLYKANGWTVSIRSTGFMRFEWNRATPTQINTTNNALTTNALIGIALTAEQAGPSYQFYTFRSGMITAVTHAVTVAGSGAYTDDSANAAVIGNGFGGTLAIQGRMSQVSICPNMVMTPAQIASWFRTPRVLVPTCRLWRLGEDGAGPQRDVSGNGSHGTVTGATVDRSGGPVLSVESFHRLGRRPQPLRRIA